MCPTIRHVVAAASGAVPAAYPAAYVYLASRQASPNTLGVGASSQRLEARIAVEIMVRHAGEAAAGGPAADLLQDVLDEVDAALLGFAPYAAYEPLELVEGRTLGLEAGLLVWRDVWRAARIMRSV